MLVLLLVGDSFFSAKVVLFSQQKQLILMLLLVRDSCFYLSETYLADTANVDAFTCQRQLVLLFRDSFFSAKWSSY
jgi:hypothetical protein